MAEQTINTVIVLRNDSTTAWESSSYQLKSGEVGVGYMTRTVGDQSTQVPVIKVGDGVHTWKDLPQAEGVFEKDVTLTSAFGRYTPSAAGYVTVPNSMGMTTSEFILDALSQIKEPNIVAPSFTLSATSLGTKEIGTTISSLAWTGTYTNGSYEFGSKKGETVYTKENGSNQAVTGYTVTCTPADGTGIVVGSVEQKEDGSATLTTGYTVSKASSGTIATVQSTCAWGASDRTPLNNVGGETSGQLAAGSATKSVTYSVNGYREGFYFGGATSKTDPSTLTSATLRNLPKLKRFASNAWRDQNKTGASYAAGDYKIKVPVGTATIIFACPETSTGVTKVYNNTVNADMTTSFTKIENVAVGGADATSSSIGNYSAEYNVWTFTPNDAYGTETELTVTLG